VKKYFTQIGTGVYSPNLNKDSTAKIAALQLRVSNTVSIKMKSTAPSKRPLACS
jgi:hypothetical protein